MAGHEFEERVTAEFRAVRTELTSHAEQLRQLDARITAEGEATRRYIDERLMAEGEATRRYFDIVAEQFRDYVKVLAEGIETRRS